MKKYMRECIIERGVESGAELRGMGLSGEMVHNTDNAELSKSKAI